MEKSLTINCKNYNNSLLLSESRFKIDPIIKKLFDHPNYRDYKSADLGSMSGYHSAGEFESYFLRSCKISLIYFLEQLKKDHHKKYRNKSKAA